MIYSRVEFDDVGFRAPGREATRILWRDVIRVAFCLVIDSGALEVDEYWAFQTTDPSLITWVQINASNDFIRKSFSEEIHRRFGEADIKEWDPAQKNQSIATYVIYPEVDIGRALYVLEDEKWWSFKSELRHAIV